MEPRLIERECGGWLAVTGPGDSPKIGVTAPSQDQAGAAFAKAAEAWRLLLDGAARRGVEPTEK